VGQGTGLGLSLSNSIVVKHQGRFEVTSKVGQGTTFRIVLPIKPALENVAASPK
jgi:two-component system, NtrC family, sensor kinase